MLYEVETPTKHSLSFQTLVEETVSREIYEDTHTLLREILKEDNFNINAGLSFKFTPSEQSMSNVSVKSDVGVDYSKKEMVKKVTEYSTIKVNVSCSTVHEKLK